MAPLYSSRTGANQKKKSFSRDRPRGPRTSAPPDLSTVQEDSKENAQSSIQGGETRDVLARDFRSRKYTNIVSYRQLLLFADAVDIFLMIVGSINGIFHGLMITCILLSTGSIFGAVAEASGDRRTMADSLIQEVPQFLYIALALFVSVFLEQSCWMYTGERQATCLRRRAVEAILNQELAFFETEENKTHLISMATDDIGFVQEAIEKMGHCLCFMISFAGSQMAAMYYCWQLGFIALATLPLIAVIGALYNKSLISLRQQASNAYIEANSIVEETVSQIRTVYSSVGEVEAIQSYSRTLEPTLKVAEKQGLAKGFGLGALKCALHLSWACIFWLGAVLVASNRAEASGVMIAISCIVFGGLTLWMATSDLQALSRGKIACANVWQVVERVPKVTDREDSIVLKSIRGRIQLRNVHFAYPSPSTHVLILNGLNLDIPQGKSMALVGSCGSGRSTVLSLIQRLYDPAQGNILLDGYDIKDLKLQWLRSQIGMVSQEPAIFATTIKENILYGRPDASDAEVEAAAMAAYAHSFISVLPLKYETRVGEGWAQLSEAQRQMIAIARAVLRNPAIFLLDEATSAMKVEREQEILDSLNSFMIGRTSIVVAHRLSTIREMDRIAVINNGRVVEMGSHAELVSLGSSSSYYTLINREQQQVDRRRDSHPAIRGAEKQITSRNGSKVYAGSSTSAWCDSLSVQYNVSVNSPVSISLTSSAFVKNCTLNPYDDLSARHSPVNVSATLRRLAAMSLPHWRCIICGSLGAIATGSIAPLSVYAMITAAVQVSSGSNAVQRQINQWALILTTIGCFSVFICTVQDFFYFKAGESVTRRVRLEFFSGILQKDVGWFDHVENEAPRIAARLMADANHVKIFCCEYGTAVVRSTSAVLMAVILAAESSWRMTLMAILLTPFFVLSGLMLMKSMDGFSSELRRAHKVSDKLAQEAILSIKTVVSCTAEERTMIKLGEMSQETLGKGATQGLKQGFLYGASQGLAQVAFAIALSLSALLLRKGGQGTFLQIFRALVVVLNTSTELSQLLAVAPDMLRALRAISSLFDTMDYQTEIDSNCNESKTLSNLRGNIEMRGVKFSYPSRPEICILNNFSMKVVASKPLVLVGACGSGKSCVVALFERFYDPQSGHVLIDGRDIRHLSLKWIRENIALVPQTPAIFRLSIRENILFGKENATEQEMIQAAKSANAHGFISSLPEGYSTFIGSGGAQLSPGQALRIAIARANLRNSSILLLDDPTSTLDLDSARVVQEVLDRFLNSHSKKTLLIVAHRLTRAMQDACDISVLHDGCIVERGDHATLMQEQGAYAQLMSS
ncbi:hypothetical protein Mapa_001973 [Marchantia paleacea]|nr:hypothetical protein Mapa_001973 [Marchantia paleacea]